MKNGCQEETNTTYLLSAKKKKMQEQNMFLDLYMIHPARTSRNHWKFRFSYSGYFQLYPKSLNGSRRVEKKL